MACNGWDVLGWHVRFMYWSLTIRLHCTIERSVKIQSHLFETDGQEEHTKCTGLPTN